MKWEELLCPERVRSYQKSTTANDLRTEFEKDYHRIIGSASFRRLQDKTQVFPLDKNDFVRTRLTHSLEVSSFARSLGQSISGRILAETGDDSFRQESKAAVCDILQCAGLIHDIGNPPFGHFGETAIQDWFKKNLNKIVYRGKPLTEWLGRQMQEDFCHFEGNSQALRVVSKLHFLVDEHGMNLTMALLGTILKYPCSSLEIDKKSGKIGNRKMGYFYADGEVFRKVQDTLHTYGKRHPLTFILEAADDLAYKTADIEDAVKKGCVSYGELLRELKKAGVGEREDSLYNEMVETLEYRYQRGLDKGYEKPELYAVQNWVIGIQGKLMLAAGDAFIRHYEEIMAGSYEKDLFYQTGAEKMMKVLGDVAYRYAFTSDSIFKLEIAGEVIFDFLLGKFVDAAVTFDTEVKQSEVQTKLMGLVSDNYKRIYDVYAQGKGEAERLYLRLLLVTDYICGMTDSYAKDLYQQLNGIT